MPNANTWGALPKTLDDNQTIAEFAAEQLSIHNADDSAHGQSNEAIYNHRIAEILDHLDQSIINGKIIASHRTYNAVVGTDPEDDFDDIQDAIDFVHSIGGGTVFIKPGTYTQAENIVLYSNITLESNDANSTIIDFNDSGFYVQIHGTDSVVLENITIRNIAITGVNYIADAALYANYVDDLVIENCIFTAMIYSSPYGTIDTLLTNCNRITLRNNYHADSIICYQPGLCTDVFITNNYVENASYTFTDLWDIGSKITIAGNYVAECAGFFYTEYGADNILITDNYVNTFSYIGIYLGAASNSIITNNHLYGNDQNFPGIWLTVLNRCIVTNNYIYNFNQSGIFLANTDTGVDRCVVSNNVCNSNDRYGIEIAGANCNNNIILGNMLANNTLGGYLNNGTGTELGHNVTT